MLPPWFSQWGLRNDSGLTVAHTAAFFGQLPEDIPRDVLGLAAIGMSVAEAAAITGTLPPWFNDWDMPVPETDLRVLAHSVVRGGFIPEGFDRWHVAGKGGWTVAHEAAFCETLPDGLPQEILDAADRNGIAVRDIVAARRNGTATIADGRRIRIGTMHVGGTKSEDIPLETLEISPGNGGIQPLPANGTIDPLPLEDGWTVLLACSLLDRTRTLKPDDPRLLECKNAYGFSLAHLSADRRTLPPGFDRWDARGSEGVTVAHHAARSRGGLPADFDAWDLRDGHGIPVAEVAVVADTLPPGFSRWDITCMRGVPVAHVAASLGRLPAGFDQWALMWPRGGQTVAHAAALAGTLPPGFDRWELEDSWGTPVVHYGAIVGGLPEDTPDRALAMTDKDGTTAAEMLLTTHVEHADHKAGLRLKELRDRAKRVVQRLRRERLRHSGE
jgi:hypothetical protein